MTLVKIGSIDLLVPFFSLSCTLTGCSTPIQITTVSHSSTDSPPSPQPAFTKLEIPPEPAPLQKSQLISQGNVCL